MLPPEYNHYTIHYFMHMPQVITRFAPSPTGYLHVGNARTAIINWLYAKKFTGKFILRIDDTDKGRSKKEYENAIVKDLKWLGLDWDLSFNQADRVGEYEIAKQKLIANKRLYPCFESPSELEIKRKLQLSSGKPPIYDRSALKLTTAQINDYIKQGKNPHYRFFIEDKDIVWHDLVKGKIKYSGKDLSDPIVIREDGSLTYMLCSAVDDIDYNITDIIRGEDHVSNTAIQIQMLEALGSAKPINFGHLSLVKAKDDKISKRIGGFEIMHLRESAHIEAMALNSFFALLGSSKEIAPYNNLKSLLQVFDISAFSKSPTTYLLEELERLNHKLLINMSYDEAKQSLDFIDMADKIDEGFWLAVRDNLNNIHEIKDWWKICFNYTKPGISIDQNFLIQATDCLPNETLSEGSWEKWTKILATNTGYKGKELFLPLRLAITGMQHGPELKKLLPIIGREEILKRLQSHPELDSGSHQ
jgi:glutamyl-tRNA synthetase